MTDKILIFEEVNKKNTFKLNVHHAAERSNALINTFHSFQDWQRIHTLEAFVELCEDPGEYFDALLVKQVETSAIGKGHKLNPAPIAEMLNIDRPNYLNLVSGKPVSEGCEPCGKIKLRPGQQAISLWEFNNFNEFLEFNGEGFTVNEPAVEKYVSGFDFYAETPEEVNVYRHYQELCRLLNRHQAAGQINGRALDIARALGLALSQAEFGDFLPYDEKIKYAILKLRQQ